MTTKRCTCADPAVWRSMALLRQASLDLRHLGQRSAAMRARLAELIAEMEADQERACAHHLGLAEVAA